MFDEEEEEIRKGPWTLEEDMKLVAYVNFLGAVGGALLPRLLD